MMSEVENLVRQRLTLTVAQRKQSVQAIAAGRADEAEPDSRRAQRYAFQRLAQQTAIIGPQDDFLPTHFLQTGMQRAGAVGLVREDGVPKGTGFNWRRATAYLFSRSAGSPARRWLQRGVWLLAKCAGRGARHDTLHAGCRQLLAEQPAGGAGLHAGGAGERRFGDADLTDLGLIALSDRADKHRLGMAVNIIQHPGGAPQQVALRDNFLLARAAESEAANVLHYTADTDGGSSGAPVFNDEWQLVALHHGAAEDESGTPVNEGIRVSALVDWLKGEAISPTPRRGSG